LPRVDNPVQIAVSDAGGGRIWAMAAWSEGYFTDIPYTDKFYAELAPGYLAFACLRRGVRPPRLEPGSSYLELGCGNGFGLNLLAAANPQMAFRGVDFHPGQIDTARRLAAEAELPNIAFDDFSFAQLLDSPAADLPKVDIVALHGVYSWVSAENRAAIVRILDRVLKPGGLAYVSYNCLPGWAALAPLQRFVAEHVARGTGDVRARVLEAFRAALAFNDGKAAFFQAIPYLKARIEAALKEEPAYLVHEYLNANSHPLYHADVARELAEARLDFAASANIADDLIHLAAPAALQETIKAAIDPVWRETLLDYAGDKPFRRDVYVRGRTALGQAEHEALLDACRFVLLSEPKDIGFEFPIPIGRLAGQPGQYMPIVEALAEGPKTYGELRRLPALSQLAAGALLQAVTLLVGARHIHPASGLASEPGGAAARFNAVVERRTDLGGVPTRFASEAAGTAVSADLAELIAIGGVLRSETSQDSAARGWELMARMGRRLVVNGAAVMDQAGNRAELARRLEAFTQGRLPRLRALGVV
jgi:SAM-dependent methyltransferase